MLSNSITFGGLLRQLRRRNGMTQAELGGRVGLSGAHISHLEKNQRLPDLNAVAANFVDALALHDEPRAAAQLIELAASARGEHWPSAASASWRRPNSHPGKIAALESPPLRLPVPPNALIGRERDVMHACDRLLNHTGRLLTLVGPPGVGKTRLGLAVAARLGTFFADGVYFVPLAGITDPALLATAVLAAMEVGEQARWQQAPRVRLIEFLRRKEILLLLDNFEQIIGAAPLLAEWLTECPKLHLLVTSRATLRLRAEQQLHVQPLAPEAAVELFIQRAQLIDSEFAFAASYVAEYGAEIATLCQRLDYLPLAIELIAARTNLLGLPALLGQLDRGSLDLLTGGYEDLPPRHRTLRQAIEYSYELLGDDERRLFQTLGVFAGSFDLDVVRALGVDEKLLQRLVEVSLVHSEKDEHGNRQFQLLGTLREFAREQLAANGELPLAHQRHAEYCLALVKEAEWHLGDEQQKWWLDRLEYYHDDLRVALTWALADQELELALGLASALCWFWGCRGHYNDLHRWLKQAIVQAERRWELSPRLQAPDLDEPLRQKVDLLANALLIQGGVIESDYDYAGASALLEHSLALDTLTGPKLTTARIYHMLTWAAVKQGDYERANIMGYQALHIVRTLAHVEEHERRPMEAYVLSVLGLNAFFSAELARSEWLTTQAKALFAELGDRRYLAYMALNLGRVALYAGEYERAGVLIHKSLAQLREIGDTDGVAQSLYEVGVVALRKGNLAQAQHAFQEGLACLRHSGLLRRFIYPMRGLAEVTYRRGQTALAAQLLGAAEMIRQSIKAPIHRVFAPDFQATLAGVRTQMDEETFAAIYTTGCSMTPEEAVAYALANLADAG